MKLSQGHVAYKMHLQFLWQICIARNLILKNILIDMNVHTKISPVQNQIANRMHDQMSKVEGFELSYVRDCKNETNASGSKLTQTAGKSAFHESFR